MTRDILIDQLKARSEKHREEHCYSSKINGVWQPNTWGNYYEQTKKFAKSLIHLGLTKKNKIALLSHPKLEWVIGCHGSQLIGNIAIGVYATASVKDVFHVIDHSDAEILVLGDENHYQTQIAPIKDKLTKIKKIIIMDEDFADDIDAISFKDFLKLGIDVSDGEVERRFNDVKEEDIATIIYTSGTTGLPKGVMLSHQNISWTTKATLNMWKIGEWDINISYLPLAHIAEQLITGYAPLYTGMHTYFATKMENLRAEMVEVEPTVFFGVPRVYEKIMNGVNEKLKEKSNLLRSAINFFSSGNAIIHEKRNNNEEIGLLENFTYRLGKRYIFSKLKNVLGLGRIRLLISGAAPISKEVLQFFAKLDLPIYEVYGMSENCGPATINTLQKAMLGSVGIPLVGSQIKIAEEDEEILVKGPNVFIGYYKDEQATKNTLKDGWLHTGDIGAIDKRGFLYITGRKKDLLITSGGKNIAPQNIESLLKGLPFVQSAVVIGDQKNYLTALLAPDKEKISRSNGAKDGQSKEAIVDSIEKELKKMNSMLTPVEQIKKFALLDEEFSVESGELTPTMKVKRQFVTEKFQNEIKKLYS